MKAKARQAKLEMPKMKKDDGKVLKARTGVRAGLKLDGVKGEVGTGT